MNKETNLLELLNYDVDGHKLVDYKFADKLMKQNLWTEEFTERVIMEYKKFIYLICTQGEMAPCYLVDQVWHLHMLYTKDYSDFCTKFNGSFIHHNPDRYKSASDELFKKTLLDYQKMFNIYPPDDVWRVNGDFRTVDFNNYYVLPTSSKKTLIKLLIKIICGG